MCLNPILIDNPYYHTAKVGHNKLHDTSSAFIPVPCGCCAECVRLRQMYIVQRTQMECINNHLFFATFTYKNKHLPTIQLNGYKLHYANFKHIQNMLKRIRKNYDLPKFSYLVASEYGGKSHRPHFHMLLSFPKSVQTYPELLSLEKKLHDIFLSEWSINVGTSRKPIYERLCDYIVTPRGRTFDFHYVNPRATTNGQDDVAFYVTKYVLKHSDYVDKLKSALRLNLSDDDFNKF